MDETGEPGTGDGDLAEGCNRVYVSGNDRVRVGKVNETGDTRPAVQREAVSTDDDVATSHAASKVPDR